MHTNHHTNNTDTTQPNPNPHNRPTEGLGGVNLHKRGCAVTTAADQIYPAAGRWKPTVVDGTTTWDGGYIETNTPATCIMDSSGDTTRSSAGEEFIVVGPTPEEIKADIKKDGNGIWIRRDVSKTWVVTWNVC